MYRLLTLFSLLLSSQSYAATYIQHIIKNDTPFEFYYSVTPTTEVPTAFSCACSGLIAANEQHVCDCYSELAIAERKYRMEYMKNISPSDRFSATHTAKTNMSITWVLKFDSYWDWLSVKSSHVQLFE